LPDKNVRLKISLITAEGKIPLIVIKVHCDAASCHAGLTKSLHFTFIYQRGSARQCVTAIAASYAKSLNSTLYRNQNITAKNGMIDYFGYFNRRANFHRN
jgi:hypothetical protein